MQKFLTDVHTHSYFSPDGCSALGDMLKTAIKKGLAFYGVSEHFDYDLFVLTGKADVLTDAETYFHAARHLQEDCAGCLNVLVGAEFGYAEGEKENTMYALTSEKYCPDFTVNSVHSRGGHDYYHNEPFYTTDANGNRVLREKEEVYREYLGLVRKSLDVPYAYDIVGHIGYPTRYAPYADKSMSCTDYREQLDDILTTIIQKNKILELNASGGVGAFLPTREIFERYFALGGRKISYGSDAHGVEKVAYCREEAVAMLKEIGFTHVTVPCRGEHVALEL